MKTNELSVIFSGYEYNGTELKEKLNDNLCQWFQDGNTPVYLTPAQERLSTTLSLLNGFIQSKVVFPVSESLTAYESNHMLEQVNEYFQKAQREVSIRLVVATSGSQAEPKIALISENNILHHCQSFHRMIPQDRNSIWLNCLPMNHIAGIMIVYRCWYHQSTMLLHKAFDVETIWKDVHRYAVTHISLVPVMLSRLLDHCQDVSPPESLRYVIVGGAKLSETLYQRAINAGWPLWISYGMTETTSTLALGRHPEQLTPLSGFEVCTGKQDILSVKGDMVISAYANDDSKSFNDGWFETSDRVKLDTNSLQVLGRNDHIIISGGNNIAPEFIEQQLSSAPGVKDIAICKIQSETSHEWGDTIAALVCGDLKTFQDWLEHHIESRYRPRYFVQTDKIPRTDIGKIDRKAVYKQVNKV